MAVLMPSLPLLPVMPSLPMLPFLPLLPLLLQLPPRGGSALLPVRPLPLLPFLPLLPLKEEGLAVLQLDLSEEDSSDKCHSASGCAATLLDFSMLRSNTLDALLIPSVLRYRISPRNAVTIKGLECSKHMVAARGLANRRIEPPLGKTGSMFPCSRLRWYQGIGCSFLCFFHCFPSNKYI